MMRSTSLGVSSGDGEGSVTEKYGALCGNGEMSMPSTSIPGEDESTMSGVVASSTSIGGVFIRTCSLSATLDRLSAFAQHSRASSRGLKRLAVNNERRGVGACGLA